RRARPTAHPENTARPRRSPGWAGRATTAGMFALEVSSHCATSERTTVAASRREPCSDSETSNTTHLDSLDAFLVSLRPPVFRFWRVAPPRGWTGLSRFRSNQERQEKGELSFVVLKW